MGMTVSVVSLPLPSLLTKLIRRLIKKKMTGKRWTKEEEFLLESLAGELPIQEIAKRLKRKRNAVEAKASRMGISVETETDSWSIQALSKILGLNAATVWEWIRKGELNAKKMGKGLTCHRKITKKNFRLFYENFAHRKQGLKSVDRDTLSFLID